MLERIEGRQAASAVWLLSEPGRRARVVGQQHLGGRCVDCNVLSANMGSGDEGMRLKGPGFRTA